MKPLDWTFLVRRVSGSVYLCRLSDRVAAAAEAPWCSVATRGLAAPGLSLLVVAHNEEATIRHSHRKLPCTRLSARVAQMVVVSATHRRNRSDRGRICGARSPPLVFAGPERQAGGTQPRDPRVILARWWCCRMRARASRRTRRASWWPVLRRPDHRGGQRRAASQRCRRAAAEAIGFLEVRKLFRQAESRFDSTVGVTGAIYALRKELFEPINERTILDDVLIPMQVVLRGFRVRRDLRAARASYDSLSESADRSTGAKCVRWLATTTALAAETLTAQPIPQPLLWQFVSHKQLRLLVPWCLLAALGANIGLVVTGPTLLSVTTLVAQIGFYSSPPSVGLAGRTRTRLLSFPYTFVLLNLAAASGLVRPVARPHACGLEGRTAMSTHTQQTPSSIHGPAASSRQRCASATCCRSFRATTRPSS